MFKCKWGLFHLDESECKFNFLEPKGKEGIANRELHGSGVDSSVETFCAA